MDTTWAYMAGLMDGEGSFSIQVQARTESVSVKVNPRMSMSLKYGNDALDLFVEHIGGKCYEYEDDTRRWVCSRRDLLMPGTKALLPYLRIKQDVASNFLRALELMPSRIGVNLSAGNRTWSRETLREVATIAFTLNKNTPGRWRVKNVGRGRGVDCFAARVAAPRAGYADLRVVRQGDREAGQRHRCTEAVARAERQVLRPEVLNPVAREAAEVA